MNGATWPWRVSQPTTNSTQPVARLDPGRSTADRLAFQMAYESVKNEVFRSTVSSWLAETREVLAIIRFNAAAGAKSFEFFDSVDGFERRLDELPPRACVTVLRGRHLPLRGRVDADFITQAMSDIPNETDYLLTALELTTIGKASWYHAAAGETHENLREDLNDQYGCLVAVGRYPRWLEDSATVISAVVPDADGSVHVGVY